MQLSPFPCHLVPLRSKYFPQHPFLKHPQPAFLPQFQRLGFTPIQNHGQNYSSIYIFVGYLLKFSPEERLTAGEYLRLRGTRLQGSGDDYIMWSLMICTAHAILFGLAKQEE